jgi:Zn finger protein HypA/HybF involved in hydrogenase expression
MNPFKGREDERDCHCNNCEFKFREGEIVIKDDEEEYCPICGQSGFIADDYKEVERGRGN